MTESIFTQKSFWLVKNYYKTYTRDVFMINRQMFQRACEFAKISRGHGPYIHDIDARNSYTCDKLPRWRFPLFLPYTRAFYIMFFRVSPQRQFDGLRNPTGSAVRERYFYRCFLLFRESRKKINKNTRTRPRFQWKSVGEGRRVFFFFFISIKPTKSYKCK